MAIENTLFNVDPSDEGDCQNGDDDIDFGEDLQFDIDLAHDIEELGGEERRMLQSLETDTDEADNVAVDPSAPVDPVDAKVLANKSNAFENGLGKSEDDAISLSDDDDEEQLDVAAKSSAGNTTSESQLENAKTAVGNSGWNPALLNDDVFDGCRLYRIFFCEPKLGLEVLLFNRRIVVSSIRPERLARLGPNSKPGVGDILCGIKGHSVGLVENLPAALHFLKLLLQKPPIEFNFIEAPKFISVFELERARAMREKGISQLQNGSSHQNAVLSPPMMALTNTITTQQQYHLASQLQVPTNACRTTSNPDIIELLDD